MANYNIAQFAYGGKSNCLIPYPVQNSSGKIYPVNILGSQDPTGDFGSTGRAPYQQIILNGKYYQNEDDDTPSSVPSSAKYLDSVPYFLRLTLPRNANYDLDFALLLIPEPKEASADLDQSVYQFIRYIHVPKSTTDMANQSTIVVYERAKFYDAEGKITTEKNKAVSYGYEDTNVQIAEAEKYSDYKDITDQGELASLVGKIFYKRVGSVIQYWEVRTDDDTTKLGFHEAGDWYGPSEKRDFAPIGAATAIVNHSWIVRDTKDTCTYDLIFKPREKEFFSRLYLYLIPNSWDNDIAWLYKDEQTDTLTQFYGRHVDLKEVKAELYQIKNLIGDLEVKRMGIWGRSELMFTINGEEIRIGPSGYYELQDFNIKYLGVAALDNRDQFTIDVQYLA